MVRSRDQGRHELRTIDVSIKPGMRMDGRIRKPSSETVGEGSAAGSTMQVNSLNPFKVVLMMTGSGRTDITRCMMVAAAAAQSTCLPRL
jgi:hypothetical protein